MTDDVARSIGGNRTFRARYSGKDLVQVEMGSAGQFSRVITMAYDEFRTQVDKVETDRTAEAAKIFHLPWSIEEELPRLLPWASAMPAHEQKAMLRELADAIRQSPEAWAQCLLEWQRTAEVYADPELRRQLVERPDTPLEDHQ
jgi:hypothetical protein